MTDNKRPPVVFMEGWFTDRYNEMYPPDKGLGEPVREFDDTLSVFDVLKEEFKLPEVKEVKNDNH